MRKPLLTQPIANRDPNHSCWIQRAGAGKKRPYSARKAQDDADRAALNKGPRPRLTTGVTALVRDLIVLERLSPFAAVTRLRARGEKHTTQAKPFLFFGSAPIPTNGSRTLISDDLLPHLKQR